MPGFASRKPSIIALRLTIMLSLPMSEPVRGALLTGERFEVEYARHRSVGGFSHQRRTRAFACLNCNALPETGPVPIRRKLTCRPCRLRNVPT